MAQISDIAELIGAPTPPISYEILRVSGIEAATPVTLVFATDAATLAAALNSPAGAILTRPDLLKAAVDPSDPRLLVVADPRYAFALAARFLQTQGEGGEVGSTGTAAGIHPTAVLGE